MGFFNRVFGSTNQPEKNNSFWKLLQNEKDLEDAIQESFSQKVYIFKHSTRCYISKMVLKNFENEVNQSSSKATFYFLDLLAHRDISDQIAEKLDVIHQSPQLIVLENGKSIRNASHQSISLKNS